MKLKAVCMMATAVFALSAIAPTSHAANDTEGAIKTVVDSAIEPLMAKYHVPGMAVGVIANGKTYVFDYGVASLQTGKPVTQRTLFEIGSVSKTFTATLAAYAQLDGQLKLSDETEKYLPSLQGSAFGKVSLLNLGTHTPGGLPLQVPDDIHDNAQLLQYFNAWKPAYAPGTYRTYANPGIGTLGLITAKSMGQDFASLIERHMFPALGMTSSYIDVPAAKMRDYAQGYTRDGAPVRMKGGVLADEAYGVRTTAADMVRFVQANMNLIDVNNKLQHAITATHTGYFKAGVLTQDLIWEQYAYPVALSTLHEGNAPAMAVTPTPAAVIDPPLPPQQNVWINKTGSTNGFGTYVAFVPQKRVGVVLLANRNFPIEERVSAAYRIMSALAASAP
ncbi:class C beta-lactamase [Paraburkholderia kirstenboschensis]|uniref:Beta-lactamase n=1 Tax=Paraburkholderia kirstenboschensis TaxID=1245436 RepID=A0ABZ0EHE6_9BURK|nr:class C beta-lactamase [Paraburkholderia kirstenboschensis]WOD15974.1 class C beta-lactamase [Paraburkholderia kirstenboschensis]